MSFRANSHEINPGKVVHKSGHLGTFPIAVHARRKKQRSCEPSVTSSIQLDISPVLPWDRVSVDNGRLFRTFHLQGFTFRNSVFFLFTIFSSSAFSGKVVLRSWYERNKHIFPASRWEPFDPTKSYDKYTVHDKK